MDYSNTIGRNLESMVHIFECIILYVCGIIFKQFRDSYDTLSSEFLRVEITN